MTESITTGPVSETITTSISRRGAPQQIDGCSTPDDGAGDGSRARFRFRFRRAGALSFGRWGQVKPEPAPTKRSAGGLSQARWRTAADKASNPQGPIVIEALPFNEALPSNAQHADSARLAADVLTPHAPASALVH